MYQRKTRQIRTLQSRLDRVVEQRDEAIKERDAAVQLNGRLATKVEQNGTADAKEMARLRTVAEKQAKDSRRARRGEELLARAAVRYWAEIGRLRKAVAERDARIAELEDRLGGDRAIKAAVPRKDPAVAELRLAKEQIAKMDAQLQILEKANAAQDVRRPALQQAS